MGPLQGIRVIELSGIGPGPFCGMLLADLGAEVVLVDRKGGALPFGAQPKHDLTRRGKRSIALDLKRPGAAEVVLRLLERADALIEGFRPGVMERLGLGPDVCLARNPRLVFGRLTGWGQHGPLAQAAGHDINYVALSGILNHGGHRDSAPSIPPTVVGDIGGGAMFMALGLVSGILRARETGQGQVIDGAITDGCAVMSMLIQGLRSQRLWVDRRQSNALDGGAHWYDCYQCADGEWISVGALEPQFYQLLLQKCGLTGQGLEQAQFDVANWPAHKEKFAAADGLGAFFGIEYRPPAEVADAEYPFTLMTGRLIFHYHTRTQTDRCEVLHYEVPESFVQISTEDAKKLNIKQGEKIKLRSRRGESITTARVTDEVAPGVLYMSMHFDQGANNLTNTALDPMSKMPELKHCGVAVEKIQGAN